MTNVPLPDAPPIRHRVQRERFAVLMLLRRYPARLALGAVLDFSEASGYCAEREHARNVRR
jgi:hypothetical protein